MTATELTDRYLSDVRALREAHERGIVGDVEYETAIARLDERFFHEVEVPQDCGSIVERINQYSMYSAV